MKVTIIYASNAGSNFVVGQILKEELEKNGHEVMLKKAQDSSEVDIKDRDLVILGSPSWYVNEKEGQPHEFMLEFMGKLGNLNGQKFAFYGCGDKSYLQYCGAVDEMEKIMEEKGASRLYDSLRINHFFFNLEKNIEQTREWAKKI